MTKNSKRQKNRRSTAGRKSTALAPTKSASTAVTKSAAASGGKPPAPAPDPNEPGVKKHTFPLHFASPLLRLYAVVTDIAILYAVILVTKRLFGDFVWQPQATAQDLGILLGYLVLPTVLWGRTIGKIIIGIVVVDYEGYPCGLRGLPREIAWKVIAVVPLGIGIFWMLFDKKKQGWHDKLAGTYVVYNPSSGISSWFRKATAPKR